MSLLQRCQFPNRPVWSDTRQSCCKGFLHGNSCIAEHLQFVSSAPSKSGETGQNMSRNLSKLVAVQNGALAGCHCGKGWCGSCNLRNTSQLTWSSRGASLTTANGTRGVTDGSSGVRAGLSREGAVRKGREIKAERKATWLGPGCSAFLLQRRSLLRRRWGFSPAHSAAASGLVSVLSLLQPQMSFAGSRV